MSQRGWDVNKALKHPADRRLVTVAIDIQPDYLAVTTPSFGHAEIPYYPMEWGEEAKVTIHGSTFRGFDIGNEIADYFSRILDRTVRLVATDPAHPRLINNETYHRPDASNEAAAADGFPFLIASHASLDDAHDKAGVPRDTLTLDAYRANIDIDGFTPWLEDSVRIIRIGDFAGYVLKACSRCPIPDLD